jgi:hypothetical protein
MLQFPCMTRGASLRARLLLLAVVMLLASAVSATAAQAAPIYSATADTATLTPVDTLTATEVFGPGTDDDITQIAAPFAIAAYGSTYTTLSVGSNGYVGFGPGTLDILRSADADDFGTPIVSAFNTDVYTANSGGIYAETRGTAPNRQLVIEWNVNLCCAGDPVTSRFQLIFTEGSTAVAALYTGTLSSSGWVGIKRDPTEFTRYDSANEHVNYPTGGTRITYRPLVVSTAALSADDTPTFTGSAADLAANVTVDVYAGADTTVAALRTLTATPDVNGDYSVTLPDADNLAEGDYTVQASQTSTTSAPQAFTVDRTAPVVSLTGPTGRVRSSTPAFTGTTGTAANDNAGAAVNIYAGTAATGTLVATLNVATSGAYTVAPNAALNDGTYTAQAVQSDGAGNQGVSAPRTFTVDTTAPSVTLTAPAGGAQTTGTPAFAGTGGTAAGDGDVVIAIRPGAATTGDAVLTLAIGVTGDGTFTVGPATALAPGQYTAVATQRDDVGNTATAAAVTFTVVAAPVAAAPAVVPAQPVRPATVEVCKSRRVFQKHVRRPSGSRLRVIATINGRKVKSTVRRDDIVIPVDLRGRTEGAYKLRVSITRTLENRKRTTVRTVTRVVYRTCS